ncbi:IN35 protein, partial [Atlantisia rogersi]|nr:IN35 protein [Atlantisia rogersi]
MAGRTVRVRGLPADLPPDRVADKLTIHFLRSRNGGGEIADVQVLPGPRPCALITFEALEVARRVLKAESHVLAFGGKRYPLEVTAYTEELSPDQVTRSSRSPPAPPGQGALTLPSAWVRGSSTPVLPHMHTRNLCFSFGANNRDSRWAA